MKKIFTFSLAIILLAISAASAQDMVPERTSSVLRLEPVVMSGALLKDLFDNERDSLGLFADLGNGLEPIPFQIDERIQKKKPFQKPYLDYVFSGGLDTSVDSDPKFDDNDELVFMPSDAGNKVDRSAWPEGANKGIEIQVSELETGAKSYVYFLGFSGPAPRSTRRYVSFDIVTDTVKSNSYTIGYDKRRRLLPTKLSVSEEAGGSGKNIIDAIKLRNNVSLSNSFIIYTLDSTDYPRRATAYINGPVRVIRRVRGIHILFWGVNARVKADSIFWDKGFTIEIPARVPVKAHKLNHYDMKLYMDFNDTAKKDMKFYSDKTPEGLAIDGKLDDAEKNQDYSPPDWMVMAGKQGAIFHRLYLDGLSDVEADLYYMDSMDEKDEPESEKGISGAGHTIRHLEKGGKRKVKLTMSFFVLKNPYQSGGERPAINSLDNPLYVKTDQGEAQNFFANELQRPDPGMISGEPPVPTYKDAAKPKKKYGLVPMIVASSDKGFGGGLMFVYSDLFSKGIGFNSVGFYTSKTYFISAVTLNSPDPKPEDDWWWRTAILAANLPSRFFYGVGNETDKDADISDYADFTKMGMVWVARRLGDSDFWVSTSARIKHSEIEEGIGQEGFDTIPTQERYPGILGLDGGYSNYLKLSLIHDSRDNRVRPTKGGYREVIIEDIEEDLGNDYDYFKYHLDLRQFISIKSDDDILAFRLQTKVTDGNPPFYELEVIGSEFTVRGFFEGRYRDHDIVALNTEWRHRLWKIMESNVFFDVGRVFENLEDDFSFKDYRMAYGVGTRLTIPPSIVMRMDIGKSKEETVFYLNFGHTF